MTNEQATEREPLWLDMNRFDWLQDKVQQLNRRAKRLGVEKARLITHGTKVRYRYQPDPYDFIALEYCPRFVESDTRPEGVHSYKVLYHDVEVVGPEVRIPGWELLARLQHIGDGQNIVHAVPGREVDPSFAARHVCDHCGTRRRRKDTFLVMQDLEEGQTESKRGLTISSRAPRGFKRDDGSRYCVLQVGRQCIRDFLGVDPSKLAWMASLWGAMREAGGSEFSYPADRNSSDYDLEFFLAISCAMIRIEGWKSSQSEKSTKGDVLEWLAIFQGAYKNPPRSQVEWMNDHRPADEDHQKARRILEWAAQLPMDDGNYYLNAGTIARTGFCDRRTTGITASLPYSYDLAMDRDTKRKEVRDQGQDSEFQGEVKERLRGLKLTVTFKTSWEGDYGEQYLVKFTDGKNVYAWFTSTGYKLDKDKTYIVTGTVKKHEDYKGVRQTTLTRCVWELVEPEVTEDEQAKRDEDAHQLKHNLGMYDTYCDMLKDAVGDDSVDLAPIARKLDEVTNRPGVRAAVQARVAS